jgi:hypothetical protein
VYHGFLYSKGIYISIDFSGALGSAAMGISPTGDIVGENHDWTAHGALLSHGQFISLDAPNSTATVNFAINPDGDIVGAYLDDNYVWHGFLLTIRKH